MTQAKNVLGVTVMLISDTLVVTVKSELIPTNPRLGYVKEEEGRQGYVAEKGGGRRQVFQKTAQEQNGLDG